MIWYLSAAFIWPIYSTHKVNYFVNGGSVVSMFIAWINDNKINPRKLYRPNISRIFTFSIAKKRIVFFTRENFEIFWKWELIKVLWRKREFMNCLKKRILPRLKSDIGMMDSWKIAQQEDSPKLNSQKFTGHSSHMAIQLHLQRKCFIFYAQSFVWWKTVSWSFGVVDDLLGYSL